MEKKIRVYAVVGPTGVGKTEFSLRLAKQLDGEIINCDAFQSFKELSIGTAKISEEKMQDISHHLFSIFDFDEEFSVVEYQKLARDKIAEIQNKGKTPILVGGSGYYLKTILYDYDFKDVEQGDYSMYSNEELHQMLMEKNSEWANSIHVNNRIRIQRALDTNGEVNTVSKIIYDCMLIGITTEREVLYDNINKRVDKMIATGLLGEIEHLLNIGATFEMQSMRAIGYKEFEDYFNNNGSLEEAIELVKRNSRRYAKKQYTWFNNQMDVCWIKKNEIEKFLEEVKNEAVCI